MAYGLEDAAGNPLVALDGVVGDGTGQTIAIVDAYDDPVLLSSTDPNFNTSDLHVFDAYYGLADPVHFLKLNQTGGTSYSSPNSGWATEEALDVEWVHVLAPGANIVLFEANSNSDADLFATVNEARSWAGVTGVPPVSVVTMSWGSSGEVQSKEATYDPYFTTPSGHVGMTFLASTGDNGAPGIYPAYSPNVVAVGGTSLYLNADNSYQSESGWSGSGGGQSQYEAEPGYQSGVQSSGMRQIPDVSFDADPNTGVAVYDSYGSGGWIQVGGTSVSSPCWAGLVGVADQLRASQGESSLDGVSQVLPTLYSLPAADFHDITSGSNRGFSAHAGYDMVTGIGSPVANKLVPDSVPVTSKGTVRFWAHAYAIGSSPIITVRDLDLAANPSCAVTLTSSAGDSETVSLPAQGGGVFRGSIVTSDGPVTAGDGILEAVPGGTITVTYDDADDGTGHPATVTDQATMFRLDHYVFTTVSGPETAGVAFPVTVSACDSSNAVISGYNGTATLSGSGQSGRAARQSRVGHVCLRRVDRQHNRQRLGHRRGADGRRRRRPHRQQQRLRRGADQFPDTPDGHDSAGKPGLRRIRHREHRLGRRHSGLRDFSGPVPDNHGNGGSIVAGPATGGRADRSRWESRHGDGVRCG